MTSFLLYTNHNISYVKNCENNGVLYLLNSWGHNPKFYSINFFFTKKKTLKKPWAGLIKHNEA